MSNPLDPENLPELISELLAKGWVVRKNVLNTDEIRAINSFFDTNREQFELNTVIYDKKLNHNTAVRGDHAMDANLTDPAPELKRVVQLVKTLQKNLNEAGFDIKRCRLRPTYFPPLQFFQKHIDGIGSLVFTFVFYVNESWEPRDRGNLIIYDRDQKFADDILPEPGSFMILLSKEIIHEVRICTRERRSILGMFYNSETDTAPL